MQTEPTGNNWYPVNLTDAKLPRVQQSKAHAHHHGGDEEDEGFYEEEEGQQRGHAVPCNNQ